MSRGNVVRTIAAGMLVACMLLLAAPPVEAGVLQPEQHDRIARLADPEPDFWGRIWSALGSTWGKISVLIDPNG